MDSLTNCKPIELSRNVSAGASGIYFPKLNFHDGKNNWKVILQWQLSGKKYNSIASQQNKENSRDYNTQHPQCDSHCVINTTVIT